MNSYTLNSLNCSSLSIADVTEAAAYFIKIDTYNGERLFGTVSNGQQRLSEIGAVAADEWMQLGHRCSGIELDSWRLLPNGLEGIIRLQHPLTFRERETPYGHKPRLLSTCITRYKAAAATRINLIRNYPGGPVWQRSYQERRLSDSTRLHHLRRTLSGAVLPAGAADQAYSGKRPGGGSTVT